MTDPFESLRHTDEPIEPSTQFSLRIRRELAQLAAKGVDEDRHGSQVEEDDAMRSTTFDVERNGAASRSQRARWFLVAAAAAACLALVAALARDGQSDRDLDVVDSPTTSTTAPSATTATSDATTATSTTSTSTSTSTSGSSSAAGLPPVLAPESVGATSFPVGRFTGSLNVIDGVVWAAPEIGSVQRLDATTGTPLGKVAVDNTGFAHHHPIGFGSVWIARDMEETVTRVDAASGAIAATIRVPGDIPNLGFPAFAPVAASGDLVYVLVWTDGGARAEVLWLDPADNEIIGSIAVPAGATNVEVGFGSLWLTTDKGVVRVDPTTGAQLASIPIVTEHNLKFLQAIRAGEGSVWLHGRSGKVQQVVRIDPATNTVSAIVTVGAAPDGTHLRSDIVFAGGSVWTCAYDAALVRIDPVTNQVVARFIAENPGGCALAVDDDSVWAAAFAGTTLYRVPRR